MKPKAVFFDLDDTLVVQDASDYESLLEVAKMAASKYNIDAEELADHALSEARRIWRESPLTPYAALLEISATEGLWAGFSKSDDQRIIDIKAWAPRYRVEVWEAALKHYEISPGAFAEDLAQAFITERRKRHILFPETMEVLEALKDEFMLAMLTNGDSDLQREKIDGAGITEYFPCIIASGDVGIGKPDPKMFEVALKHFGISKEEAVMVGNNLKSDNAGARAAGVGSIWINRINATCPNPDVFDLEIENLKELPFLPRT